MDTALFEKLLQDYLAFVDSNADQLTIEDAAYAALTEAAGLLGVSMLRERTS